MKFRPIKIKKCRLCKGSNFEKIFNLGNFFVSNFVEKKFIKKGIKAPLNLIYCKKCSLLQLDCSAPQEIMYRRFYWYRSGVTSTMIKGLKDIYKSVEWYQKNLDAECLYMDDTWGLVSISGTKIAFVVATQHPPHICFEVDHDYVHKKLGHKKFKKHRDGTESCYITDCDGNFIEFLKCQKKT